MSQGHKCQDRDSNPHPAEQINQSLSLVLLSSRPRHPMTYSVFTLCRSDISTLRLVYIPGGSPMMHNGHPSRQTPSSSYTSSPSSNPSPQRYLSEPGNQHPQGLPYTGTSHPLPSRQSSHGGVGLPPSPHMGMSPMNGHDQGNGLVSSQAVNQSTSPPLYGQAMINGYPLSGMIINKPET